MKMKSHTGANHKVRNTYKTCYLCADILCAAYLHTCILKHCMCAAVRTSCMNCMYYVLHSWFPLLPFSVLPDPSGGEGLPGRCQLFKKIDFFRLRWRDSGQGKEKDIDEKRFKSSASLYWEGHQWALSTARYRENLFFKMASGRNTEIEIVLIIH